jgi:hypothetical protein
MKIHAAKGTTRVPQRRRRHRGAEVIEAALVFPLLLGLAFGTVEFGYFFYLEHNLQAAAREGARAAIPAGAGDNTERGDLAIAAADRVMRSSGFGENLYEVTWEVLSDQDGEFFQVSVDVNWGEVNEGVRPMRMISLDDNGERFVTGTATMRIEQ